MTKVKPIMMKKTFIENVINSRKQLSKTQTTWLPQHQDTAEGGCGVIGIACNEKVAGKHLLQALTQMRNRGNGKGGGIAAIGLDANQFGVTETILKNDYLLMVAYLETDIRKDVEEKYITPIFKIDKTIRMQHINDYRELAGLDIKPPEVYQYFVQVKEQVYKDFIEDNNLKNAPRRKVEDEIVYQNTYKLNKTYYASMGKTQAFVLSHGKNMVVLKMVGYGDDVIRYYQLEDLKAHVWIGHHRYPTKGRVWHPGGAHPFVGLNEALVHNGDFANYSSITEYLAQKNIHPLFLTDTEVSVLVFDLLHRTYDYPLEYVIEALAPTTERDFTQLPSKKQQIYEAIQTTHIHSSPDGPWFFLIGQSAPSGNTSKAYRLIGITDTSMLRPQVFALQESPNSDLKIGFAASEKQAIDAALESLSKEDQRFWSTADMYWNARGGSHTDGGAFIFSVIPQPDGSTILQVTDKFGNQVKSSEKNPPFIGEYTFTPANEPLPDLTSTELFKWFTNNIPKWQYQDLFKYLSSLTTFRDEKQIKLALETLTLLMDGRYPTGHLRRSSLMSIYTAWLNRAAISIKNHQNALYHYLSPNKQLPDTGSASQTIVVNGTDFSQDGKNSLARQIVRLYKNGYKKFIVINTKGHRFIANGLGKDTKGVRIDVYGSPGDYLGSGIDGAEVIVHGNGQDQYAQIMKSGKLVIYGDVGQTFGYAAKGGSIFIMGNAAGRPLINAVGKPKVIINGTCLDYLAESFMAGDPLNGGGFIVLNGIKVNSDGSITDLEIPYPGGNLFSLASGGAIYIRDPYKLVGDDQLNGGEFTTLTKADWELIHPYLEENAKLFNIPLNTLLKGKSPQEIYRKIQPRKKQAVHVEEAWVKEKA